ncbi:uncharacterized protein Tco025E_09994 [Trypanosoma conorhini]|uniref:Uncharacterized protein n=1 Tax=Trypanosoma conorhini TaxID=83891 RepID=A0A422MQN8_9TRYP|nr:uncharacterized protein Tco025E_09994 [Trypanosoma conorhini]RNE95514.1 hypothetical protein Tco025E_09994 [Trypanosoma conorhini]
MLGVRGSVPSGCGGGDASRPLNVYGGVDLRRPCTAGLSGGVADDRPVLRAFFTQTLGAAVGTACPEENSLRWVGPQGCVLYVGPADDGDDDAAGTTYDSRPRPLQGPAAFRYVPRPRSVTPQREEMRTCPSFFSCSSSSCRGTAPAPRRKEGENAVRRPLAHLASAASQSTGRGSLVPSCGGPAGLMERIRCETASLWERLQTARSHLYGTVPLSSEKGEPALPEKNVSHVSEEATAVSLTTESYVGVSPVGRPNAASRPASVSSPLYRRLRGEVQEGSHLSAPRLRGQRLREAWGRDAALPEHLHRVADIEGTGSVRLSRLIIVLRVRRYLDWSEQEARRTVAWLANHPCGTPDAGAVTPQEANSTTRIVIREEDGTFYLNAGAFFSLLRALLLL